MKRISSLMGPMRVPFLILTPACVLLGVGTAVWTAGRVNLAHALLVLVGALGAHVSVNALNETFDFRSGLDSRTQRTPFSGGSGTLPTNPEMARSALATGLVALAVCGLVGLFLVGQHGWGLLPLGLLGMLTIVAYTPWLARAPILSLLAPGLGFGTLMVMGTDFALTGSYSWTAFVGSLVPFFLVNNLLLLNQYPDVKADRSVGRRNYPIVFGRRPSSLIYVGFLLATYLSIVAGVVVELLPPFCLIGLATSPLAVRAGRDAWRYADEVPRLIPALGTNVLINILTPTLVAAGLLIG